MSEWTTCGSCGRVIYIAHSNHGNCTLCDPPSVNGTDLEVETVHDVVPVTAEEPVPEPIKISRKVK